MRKLYGKINDRSVETYTEVNDHSIAITYAWDMWPDGFLPVVVDNEKPEITEGHRLVYHMYVKDGILHKEYLSYSVDTPLPAPRFKRTFSKLKLYVALQSTGLWETLRTWMAGQTLPNGVNLATAFDVANELSDDNELFTLYLEHAKTALGLTDAQVEAILDGCRK